MMILHKLHDMHGYSLHAHNGEIGKLEEVYFDDQHWMVRYFVVHTGSWLLGRQVLILPDVIKGVDVERKQIDVDLTREQIEHSPQAETKLPVSRHYEREYYQYYDMEPYWIGDPLFGATPHIPASNDIPPEEPEHPHLRSSATVQGYLIHASDDEIGHVDDFILEEPGWALRYLEVDTRNWLPGKHVLVAPAWVRRIEWDRRAVVVDLAREVIKSAPAYRPGMPISREYQVSLYKHYGKTFMSDDN